MCFAVGFLAVVQYGLGENKEVFRSGAGGPQTGESGKEHRGHRPGQRHEISVYADVPAEMIKTR